MGITIEETSDTPLLRDATMIGLLRQIIGVEEALEVGEAEVAVEVGRDTEAIEDRLHHIGEGRQEAHQDRPRPLPEEVATLPLMSTAGAVAALGRVLGPTPAEVVLIPAVMILGVVRAQAAVDHTRHVHLARQVLIDGAADLGATTRARVDPTVMTTINPLRHLVLLLQYETKKPKPQTC